MKLREQEDFKKTLIPPGYYQRAQFSKIKPYKKKGTDEEKLRWAFTVYAPDNTSVEITGFTSMAWGRDDNPSKARKWIAGILGLPVVHPELPMDPEAVLGRWCAVMVVTNDNGNESLISEVFPTAGATQNAPQSFAPQPAQPPAVPAMVYPQHPVTQGGDPFAGPPAQPHYYAQGGVTVDQWGNPVTFTQPVPQGAATGQPQPGQPPAQTVAPSYSPAPTATASLPPGAAGVYPGIAPAQAAVSYSPPVAAAQTAAPPQPTPTPGPAVTSYTAAPTSPTGLHAAPQVLHPGAVPGPTSGLAPETISLLQAAGVNLNDPAAVTAFLAAAEAIPF